MEEIRTIIANNTKKILDSHLDVVRPSQIFDDDGIEIETGKKENQESPIPIGENNMRDLLQFSQNNQYFLFINRLTMKMYVYKLEYIRENPLNSLDSNEDDTEGLRFEFKRIYKLAFNESRINEIYKNNKEYQNDTREFFLKTRCSFRVENNGSVSIILVRNDPKKLTCQVDISIFSNEGGGFEEEGDYT